MKLGDNEILELSTLCSALADGVLTDPQRARLNELLESADARRFYVRYAGLGASLFEYAGEMQAEPANLQRPELKRRRVVWIWFGSLATAAAILIGFWVGLFSRRDNLNEESVTAEADEFVGHLTGSKDCRWVSPSSEPRMGDALRRGARLELARGHAEVTFDCGAQILLEGPASLDLISPWGAALRRGALRANVPVEAVGFRVFNSAVEVWDMGTEFSMVADESGSTEVFVLQGSVEAASRDGRGQERETVVLREKQSRRFARSGISEVRDSDQKFRKFAAKVALDRLLGPVNYVHWRFDEMDGNIASAEAVGKPATGFEAQLISTATLGAVRTNGRWGRALRFGGEFFVKAPFPYISERTPRTVAFWVKIPTDAPLADRGAMVAWPLAGKTPRLVEIGWNHNPNQGALGALRTGVGRAFTVGTTSLRDGQWHHIAVAFTPASNPDSPMQVKQYVDGRLEGQSAKHGGTGKRTRNAAGMADDTGLRSPEFVWIGRSAATARRAHDRFRGELDEIFIADRALTPKEIQRLVKENQLATVELASVQ